MGTVYTVAEITRIGRHLPTLAGYASTSTGHVSPTQQRGLGCSAADITWRAGRRRSLTRRHQEWSAIGRGNCGVRQQRCRRTRLPHQAIRSRDVEDAIPIGAADCLSHQRTCGCGWPRTRINRWSDWPPASPMAGVEFLNPPDVNMVFARVPDEAATPVGSGRAALLPDPPRPHPTCYELADQR